MQKIVTEYSITLFVEYITLPEKENRGFDLSHNIKGELKMSENMESKNESNGKTFELSEKVTVEKVSYKKQVRNYRCSRHVPVKRYGQV